VANATPVRRDLEVALPDLKERHDFGVADPAPGWDALAGRAAWTDAGAVVVAYDNGLVTPCSISVMSRGRPRR